MIQINLLPGAKKVRGRGALGGLSAGAVGALFSGAAGRVKDPFLVSAVGSVAVAALFMGGTYLSQTRAEVEIAGRQEQATADSARYALVIRERRSAVAQRDSVARQLRIIRAIDNDRFVWPHVMDEVSRALPPYTWLTSVEQTSAPRLSADIARPDGAAAPAAAKADSVPTAALKFRVVGNTVDIQALTRFMKDLEASPFVQNVSLNKSDLVLVDGKEVTQFQLDCEYQTPDAAAIRMTPVSFPAR